MYSRFAGILCLVVFLVGGLRATGFEDPIIENGSAETVVADDATDGVASLQTEAVTVGTQPVKLEMASIRAVQEDPSGTRAG